MSDNPLNVVIDQSHFKLRQSTHEYIQKRLEKLDSWTKNFPTRDLHISQEHSERDGSHRFTITLALSPATLVGSAVEHHLRAAFDRAFKRLLRQVKELKEHLRRETVHHRRFAAKGPDQAESAPGFPYASPGHEQDTFRQEAGRHFDDVRRFLQSEARQLQRREGITVDIDQVIEIAVDQATERYVEKPRAISARGWLYEIALGVLEDRAQEMGATGPGKEVPEPDDEIEAIIAYFGHREEEQDEQFDIEVRRELSARLADLPRDWRRAFRLHYLEGFEFEVMERLLDLSRDQILFRVRGAAEFLRDHLGDRRPQD